MSFSLNCQSLKWVKTQYAYSELRAVELIFEHVIILLHPFQSLLVP